MSNARGGQLLSSQETKLHGPTGQQTVPFRDRMRIGQRAEQTGWISGSNERPLQRLRYLAEARNSLRLSRVYDASGDFDPIPGVGAIRVLKHIVVGTKLRAFARFAPPPFLLPSCPLTAESLQQHTIQQGNRPERGRYLERRNDERQSNAIATV